MWLLNFLPDWFWHILTLGGAIAVLVSMVLKNIPIINQYNLPIKLVGIAAVLFGIWMEGGIVNEAKWQSKVADMEAKLAAAEKQSVEVNTEIITKVVTKTKLIKERGDDIIKYVDREVAVDKEVVKFVENCPIPEIIINTHNAAALNRPIEEKK